MTRPKWPYMLPDHLVRQLCGCSPPCGDAVDACRDTLLGAWIDGDFMRDVAEVFLDQEAEATRLRLERDLLEAMWVLDHCRERIEYAADNAEIRRIGDLICAAKGEIRRLEAKRELDRQVKP
jgi:hypothetical protein